MKLDNKVAIITGGAMGIGRGIVETFLKYGAKVYILDYSDNLDSTVNELSKNGQIFGENVDIRNSGDVEKIIDKIYENEGKIDILVNNAGVARLSNFLEVTDEERDFQIDINVKGAWNVSKHVVKHMSKNEKGAIINMSSVTGNTVADEGEVAYALTKAAITGFTKGLAADLAKYNIRVNAIRPGYILTPMVNGIAVQSNSNNPQSVIDGIAKAIPLKRLGKPTEVGELAAFLASDESSYLTGADFVIDGGSTLPETTTVGV